ncbi:MAG TPA: hypothetical protein DD490_02480 [Acidobacteria bacterium]|nr:hypothetical protein [Acidobacteriota bacterium]
MTWRTGLGFLGLGAVLSTGSAPTPFPNLPALYPAFTLEAEHPVRRELPGGAGHDYLLDLSPGETVEVSVEQEGVDISLTLIGPEGETLLTVDTPKGAHGVERLFSFAKIGGSHRLRVLAEGPPSAARRGSYGLRRAPPRAAGPADRLRARAWLEYDRGERLRRKGTPEEQRRALLRYAVTLRLSQALGDRDLQAVVLYRIARVSAGLGDVAREVESYERALPLVQDVGLRVSILNNLFIYYRLKDDPGRAAAVAQEALALAPRTGEVFLHAAAVNNLGALYRSWGENGKALALFDEAVTRWTALGPSRQLAQTLCNRAEVLLAIGDPRPVLGAAKQCHRAWRDVGEPGGLGYAERLRGVALARLGSPRIGLAHLEMSRRQARQAGSPWHEEMALNETGSILLELGEPATARVVFEESRRIARANGDRINEAFSLSGLGSAFSAQGHREAAIRLFAQSERLTRRLGDPNALALVLHRRALAERALGRVEEALATVEQALSLVEQLRRDVGRSGLRLHVIGARADLYDLKVDLLLQLHARHPWQGFAEAAFAASEWRRSRSLLEGVKKIGSGPPLLVGAREVQARLHRDTALLALTAGEDRSFLWWMEKDLLVVAQDLPPRAELEALVAEAGALLSRPEQTRSQGRTQRILDDLALHLLGPVAVRLPKVRRLVVVADDVLQALPFAVLPAPGTGEPLVESHAVVELPSASLAVALQERSRGRARPPLWVAVFGDPVFSRSDPRLLARRGRRGAAKPNVLPRLVASSREVKEILGFAPTAKSRGFIGFAANRRAALDPVLGRFRYLHFAAHGFVDPENPNLSGIQLSRVDPQGRPLERGGLLSFEEVYSLDLPVDLVTLGACRTADGLRVRSEGPLGLTRSFLYAGASRVIGTLWDVDDRDAADLMTFFYRSLLLEGKAPAFALQDAQRQMRAQEATRAPYHWAGFVLQGDWR